MFTASRKPGRRPRPWSCGTAAPPVVDTYPDHHRIHDGDAESITDAAYTAWRHDRQQGLASVLIAETRENVTALNVRARRPHP